MIEKVCKVCGESKPLTDFYADKKSADRLRYECKTCCKSAVAARTKANPERTAAIQKRYHARHHARSIDRGRSYRDQNRDMLRAKARAWYYANRAHSIAMSTAYARKHAERLKAKNRERYKTDLTYRARVLADSANRQRFEQAGSLTADQWNEVWDSYLGLCVYCGKPAAAMDHVDPVVGGGRHEAENVAPACKSCNSRKRSTPLLAFIVKGGLRPRVAA